MLDCRQHFKVLVFWSVFPTRSVPFFPTVEHKKSSLENRVLLLLGDIILLKSHFVIIKLCHNLLITPHIVSL
jgi:hypothetical protein